jgi:hypothetical protein
MDGKMKFAMVLWLFLFSLYGYFGYWSFNIPSQFYLYFMVLGLCIIMYDRDIKRFISSLFRGVHSRPRYSRSDIAESTQEPPELEPEPIIEPPPVPEPIVIEPIKSRMKLLAEDIQNGKQKTD